MGRSLRNAWQQVHITTITFTTYIYTQYTRVLRSQCDRVGVDVPLNHV